MTVCFQSLKSSVLEIGNVVENTQLFIECSPLQKAKSVEKDKVYVFSR